MYGRALSVQEVELLSGVSGSTNQPPIVSAGADQSLQLPTTSVQVLAQISDDGEPSPPALTYDWTQVSGPGTAVFTPGTLSGGELPTDITVDIEGTYVLRLTASDGELSGFDEMTLTLLPEELENTAPEVDAGADQSLQLPATSVQVLAQISDDGEPSPSMLTYEWTQVSGPDTAVILPCLLYTSPSPRDGLLSRMPSSA